LELASRTLDLLGILAQGRLAGTIKIIWQIELSQGRSIVESTSIIQSESFNKKDSSFHAN